MTTPAIPPESWWERTFFPRMEDLLQKAVADLGALVAGTGASGTAGGSVHGPAAVWPLPMDALMLARLAMAAQIPGITKPLFPRQVVTAPAFGIASFTFPVAPGTVVVQVGALQGNVSVHDPAITATILTDGQNLELSSAPGTADIDTILPAYAVVRSGIEATFVNGTANPVEFTITPQIAIVDANEYDTVWLPLFRASYSALQTLAQALQATGGGS